MFMYFSKSWNWDACAEQKTKMINAPVQDSMDTIFVILSLDLTTSSPCTTEIVCLVLCVDCVLSTNYANSVYSSARIVYSILSETCLDTSSPAFVTHWMCVITCCGCSCYSAYINSTLFNCAVSAYGWLKGTCKELLLCVVRLGAATLTGAVTITGNDDTLGCSVKCYMKWSNHLRPSRQYTRLFCHHYRNWYNNLRPFRQESTMSNSKSCCCSHFRTCPCSWRPRLSRPLPWWSSQHTLFITWK